MKKLLCWLGFHQWYYYSIPHVARECNKCNKAERYDFTNRKWVEAWEQDK